MFGGIRRLSYSQLQFGLAALLDALTGPHSGLILRYTMSVRELIAHIPTKIIANWQY